MEGRIKVGDKYFRPYRSRDLIAQDLERVAQQIRNDYSKIDRPLFLAMLNGAFVFAADLARAVPGDVEMEFVRYSTYAGLESSGQTRQLIGLGIPIEGRHILIVEDIIDTGYTIRALLADLKNRGAASIRIATMFFKKEAYKETIPIDYVGHEIPNLFVVGYGLDYAGLGRNLPDLHILDE